MPVYQSFYEAFVSSTFVCLFFVFAACVYLFEMWLLILLSYIIHKYKPWERYELPHNPQLWV